jgi:secreted trypsin-like serine protease
MIVGVSIQNLGGAPMRRGLILGFTVVLATLLTSGPAGAIVYGQFDGNRHPNVGSIVADWRGEGLELVCTGTLIDTDVFLTASHCTSFLESVEVEEVFVTFDPTFDEDSPLIEGTMVTNPNYNAFSGQYGMSDPGDIAVILLHEAATGITPAELPPPGLLTEMKQSHELQDQLFTAVGYGTIRETRRGGFDAILDNTKRRFAVQEYLSLTKAWLTLSMNEATQNGGTCYGDSGGPHFLGAGQQETNMVVSITVTGDAVCKAIDKTYRLDTPSARSFLKDYVTLPS